MSDLDRHFNKWHVIDDSKTEPPKPNPRQLAVERRKTKLNKGRAQLNLNPSKEEKELAKRYYNDWKDRVSDYRRDSWEW